MAFDTTQFPSTGGGYVVRNSITLQAQEAWKISDDSKHRDINTNLQGKIAEQQLYRAEKLSLKPIATSANLASLLTALVGWRKSDRGKLIFPATDVSAVVQTRLGGTSNAGQSLTYFKTAFTNMPTLKLAPDKEMFGDVEITALTKSATDGSGAADFCTVANSTYTEPALTPLTLLYPTYTLAIGTSPASPFDQIVVDESTGIQVKPMLKLNPVTTSTYGPVNYRVEDVSLEITFRPMNLSVADYRTLFPMQGTGVKRGAPARALGKAVSILDNAGTGFFKLLVPNMIVKPGSGLVLDPTKEVVEQITLVDTMTDASGTLAAPFTLGVQ